MSDDPEVPEPPEAAAPEPPPTNASRPVIAIMMEYRGHTRVTELPLDEQAIGTLALEAEMRGMRLGELVAQVIERIIESGDFDLGRGAK